MNEAGNKVQGLLAGHFCAMMFQFGHSMGRDEARDGQG